MFLSLAKRIRGGGPPKGLFWNFFEVMLVFIRDEVARPSIGKHDADKFLPFLWNMFFFILFCNLLGILPWAGSPTGALMVTAALAGITFCAVVGTGMQKFGVGGFFKSLVPHMELPKAIAIVLVPMIFVIELVGLLIRHVVLAVRLLANMFAGHLVLAVILGFIAAAANHLFLAWLGITTASVAGLGRAYLVGVVRGLPAGLYIHVFVGTYLSAWQSIRTRAEVLHAGKTISEEMSSVFELAKFALLVFVVFAMAIPAFAADDKKAENPNGGAAPRRRPSLLPTSPCWPGRGGRGAGDHRRRPGYRQAGRFGRGKHGPAARSGRQHPDRHDYRGGAD